MSGIVVLISGRGSNLQALVEAGLPVTAVISNRAEAGGLEFARSRGIPTEVVAAPALARDNYNPGLLADYDRHLLARVQSYDPELVVLAGFMRVLGAEFVQPLDGRVINIHPSLLPAFPGLHTHRRALEAGVWFHGCTVHYVTEELDQGPIICQSVVYVHPNDTEEQLARRVLEEEHRILPEAVRFHLAGGLHLRQGRVHIDHEQQGRVSIVPDRTGEGP